MKCRRLSTLPCVSTYLQTGKLNWRWRFRKEAVSVFKKYQEGLCLWVCVFRVGTLKKCVLAEGAGQGVWGNKVLLCGARSVLGCSWESDTLQGSPLPWLNPPVGWWWGGSFRIRSIAVNQLWSIAVLVLPSPWVLLKLAATHCMWILKPCDSCLTGLSSDFIYAFNFLLSK